MASGSAPWDGLRTPSGKRLRPEPADRARQFLPFAALTGYYDLLRERDRVPEPRHELTEEEAWELSETLARLRPRDLVRVCHYREGTYVETCATVREVDAAGQALRLVGTRIEFEDIRAVEVVR